MWMIFLLLGMILKLIKKVMHDLIQKFALKTLGSLSYFLGFEAHRDQTELYLTQSKHISDKGKHD